MPSSLIIFGGGGPTKAHWGTVWMEKHPEEFFHAQVRRWTSGTAKSWAEEIAEQLDRREQRVAIVGHSLGCNVALRLAEDRPDLIRGLFLVAPPDLSQEWAKKSEFYSDFDKSQGFEKIEADTMILFSESDPYASIHFSETFGREIGARSLSVGHLGHIGSDAHLGPWDNGLQHFRAFEESLTDD